MLTWRIGDVTITRVLESETPFLRGGGPESAVPDAFPEAVREIKWLQPHFVDESGRMRFSIHALLVDAPGLRLVVDTCVGNDKPRNVPFWNMLQWRSIRFSMSERWIVSRSCPAGSGAPIGAEAAGAG